MFLNLAIITCSLLLMGSDSKNVSKKTEDHIWPPYQDSHNNFDYYFDRAVFVGFSDSSTSLTIGVFVTPDRIVTSFNPFRIKYDSNPSKTIKITYLISRQVRREEDGFLNVTHETGKSSGSCMRQAVPIAKQNIKNEQWHGTDKKHSPVHDLFVIRISNIDEEFLDSDPNRFTYNHYWHTQEMHRAGPIVTNLASPKDYLYRDFRIATGMFNRSISYISSVIYTDEDNAIEDCEELFPRVWGHFICIEAIHDTFMGSGALLMKDNKLFGVGSFTLNKGNKTIHVFTDVRPYYRILNFTCISELPLETYWDQFTIEDYDEMLKEM